MFKNYKNSAKERLLRYIQIDTQSDPHSNTQPSSEKQTNLGRKIIGNRYRRYSFSGGTIMNLYVVREEKSV